MSFLSEFGVTFHFYNILAKYAGTNKIELQLIPGTTLRDALMELSKQISPQLQKVIFQNGLISKYIKVFKGLHLISEEMYDEALVPGDEIKIILAIAGG